MLANVTFYNDQELPTTDLIWTQPDGTSLYDFSSGWTFSLRLARVTAPATTLLLKTTGITGAATSPNLSIAWSTSDWSGLEASTNGTKYVGAVYARRTADSYDMAANISVTLKAAPGTSAVSPSSYPVTVTAASVTLADAGGFYASTDVEGALAEVAEIINVPSLDAPIEDTVFDYYLDATNGLDANSGLTPLAAKQTLAGIVAIGATLAGKRIGLKRGDTYREAFNLPAGGSANAPTVVGAWGTGARPIIKATSVQATSGWSVYSGSVYVGTATSISTAAGLWVDEVNGLVRVTPDQTAINAPGQYFSTGSTLWVWMPDSSNPGVGTHVFEKRSNAASHMVTTVDHYRVEDISLRQATNPVCINSSGQGVVFRRCEVAYNMGTAIMVSGRAIVEDCEIHHNWNGKEYATGTGAGNGVLVTGTGAHGTVIRRNRFWENYVQVLTNSSVRDVQVLRNQMFRAHVNGIDIQGAGAYVYHNFVHHRPTSTSGHGIDTQSGGSGLIAKNNIVYCDYTANAATNIQCIAVNTGTGHDVDYNLYYLTDATQSGVDIGKDTSSVVYRTLALWQAATTFDDNSLSADPVAADLTARNARPTATSPTISAGVVLSGVNDGYFGTAPDMGPYEVVSAV